MKVNNRKKGLALLMGLLLGVQLPASLLTSLKPMDSYAYTGAATVKASSLNVRSGAGTGYSAIGRLAAGTPVKIIGEQRGTDGNIWYQIQYTGSNGSITTGYVSSSYIRLPVSYSTDADFEAYLTSQGFPESYKSGLRQLHAQYPNWVFVAKNTGLDWNTVIDNESVLGRNLVSKNSVSSWKSVEAGAYDWNSSTWTGLDGSSWVAASQDIIKYYMDPRNFLDETYVFQFLSHEYDANRQTKEGLTSMVSGTFLSGSTDSTGTDGSDFSGGASSTGPGGSGSSGPSGSSGSAEVSTKGPGGRSGQTDDYRNGPGVSGTSGRGTASPTTESGTVQSPSGSGGAEVSLEAPHASITPKVRNYVGVNENQTVVTGAAAVPGASQNASQPAGSQGSVTAGKAPGSSGQSSGGTSQGPATTGQAPGSTGQSSGGASQDSATTGQAPGSTGQTGSGPAGSTGNGAASLGSSPAGNGTAVTVAGFEGTASYADIIMKAAAQSGVSPYVLAAMILQEQGNSGGTALISGAYSGYEGYYNFFNVEAYQSGSMTPTQMGLRYASQSGSYGRPWNTVEKSILGGAQNYGDNYVKAGQNTFYLKKFNVQGGNLYKHQYMSNIQGAASEAAKLSQAYTDAMKSTALEFHIPVFNNMPEQACAAPTGDGSPNNKLSSLEAVGYNLTPSFSRDTESYSLIVGNSVSDITINGTPAGSQAQVSGTGTISLPGQATDITVTVTAQNGSTRSYVIHVVKQGGGASAGNGVTTVSPDGSSQGPGGTSGPGSTDSNAQGPGGSNVTIVEVGS